ncbi:MAG: DUF2946 family protein [Beijerinckiaceae bacterium]|nr:DUF2946 family protein [Beijerinckiaceae bacterium]
MTARSAKWKRSRAKGAPRTLASARHFAVVCLAILGLYLQITAAAACLIGPSAANDASSNGQLFPICHADHGTDASSTPGGDQGSTAQHSCPFCSHHSQAVMAPPDRAAVLEPLFTGSAEATHAPFLTRSLARFAAGAPPRGPPATA